MSLERDIIQEKVKKIIDSQHRVTEWKYIQTMKSRKFNIARTVVNFTAYPGVELTKTIDLDYSKIKLEIRDQKLKKIKEIIKKRTR